MRNFDSTSFLGSAKRALTALAGAGALALAGSCASAQPAPAQPAPGKPNVVFILADDLGWMDTSAYGSKFYETPNIDKLRQRGMMFTRAYSAHALCSPTRASILTGQHPSRLRITQPQGHVEQVVLDPVMPASAGPAEKVVPVPTRNRLPLSYNTLGQSLKGAGYQTAFMGKWHLGSPPYVPGNFGFDTVVGGGPFSGPISFFSPYRMGEYLPDGPKGEHIDDRLGAEAVKFLEANKNKPFFLNVWSYGVHAPFQAKPKYIADFKAKVDPQNPQKSPTYAAMVKSTDDLVGRITNTLDRLKLTDKTLLIFFSDNGGNMYNRVDGTTPTSNFPLRNGKGSIWEGGTRVPMIVSWPGHVKPNSLSDALVSSIDFYPTLLQITGAQGKAGQVVDGVDLTKVWEGTGQLERDAIYSDYLHTDYLTETPASSYVHQNNWKLIRFYADNPDQTDRYELYDLSKDIGESNNLAAQMPDKVRELNALITRHLKETDALVPFANPKYIGPVQVIDGWNPLGTASLRRDPQGLHMISIGDDPYFYTDDLPVASGPYVVKARIKTDIKGGGLIFWGTKAAPKFNRERRVDFELFSDNAWHEYEIKVATPELNNLRFDPGTASGTATFDWIRLYDKNGALVKAWEFDFKDAATGAPK